MSMNINNITIISIIAFIIIQIIIIRPNNQEPDVTNSFIKASQEYIKKIEVRGNKRVIIIGNGPIFNEQGEAIPFQDSAIVDPVRKRLAEENYTVITMALPCLELVCQSKYFNLGLSAVALKPEAIILHSISSGLNTDTLDKVFREENIPVYIYGRDLPVDYKLYVGPDNNRLGANLANGLLEEIKEETNILYIETVRLLNGDLTDNGYIRINAARELLKKRGANKVDTLFTYWSKTKTYEQVKLVIESGKKIDYIVTPSVETAQGAIEAVREKSLERSIRVVSMDFNPQIAALIQDGSLYATVSQEFNKQSDALASTVINQLNNGVLPRDKSRKRFASGLITKSNIKTYLDEEGNYIF